MGSTKLFYEGIIFCIAHQNAENKLYHTKDEFYEIATKYADATQSILNLLAYYEGSDDFGLRDFRADSPTCRALNESQLQFIFDTLEDFRVIESYYQWSVEFKCYRLPYRYWYRKKWSCRSIFICVIFFYLVPILGLALMIPEGIFSFTVQYNLTHTNKN